MKLKSETCEAIDKLIPQYPVKRSAVLPLLHLVQGDQGYISSEGIEWIAEKLELAPINVYELVTFYPYFRQEKLGKVHVRVCRTLSCALVGAYDVADRLAEALDCPLNTTKANGDFTIEYAECLASCGSGPVVLVDEDLYEKVCEKDVDGVADTILAKVNGSVENKETA